MSLQNRVVIALLRSPLYRVLSGSTALVRYHGRRSGRVFTTPVQYVQRDDEVVILVGCPWQKSWWRNFEGTRELQLMLEREWVTMLGRAHVGSDDPESVRPRLEAYLERFPHARKALEGETDGARVRNAVVVACRPAREPVTRRLASASKGA